MNTPFIFGLAVGGFIALAIMLCLFLVIALKAKTISPEVKKYNEETIALMRERNEQEKQTQHQLKRIGNSLSELAETYRAR